MTKEIPHAVELLRHAALLPPARALAPVPGDWVVDNTRGCPGFAYIGKLEAIEFDAAGAPVYIVSPIATGLPERWVNTDVLVIKPGFEEKA